MGNAQMGKMGKQTKLTVPERNTQVHVRRPPPQGSTDTSTRSKLPPITPRVSCKLRLLRLQRTADHLLLEKETLQRIFVDMNVQDELEEESQAMEKLRAPPLIMCTMEDVFTNGKAIVKPLESSREYYIPVLSIVNKERMHLGCMCVCTTTATTFGPRTQPRAVVGLMESDARNSATMLKIDKAPVETYDDVGGLESVIAELKETVEMPLTHPQLFEEMGIVPPRGIILYGPPGTGKTLLAKAVANATSATFIRVVGSQLIQKESGAGPKLVREMFEMARDHAPSIIFLDEVDAIGAKRFNTSSAGEQEVHRTLLELLTALDGFEHRGEVKVIMATNRVDTLDPALIRPGRIDRKIEVPPPDEADRKRIFDKQTAHMAKCDDVRYTEAIGRFEQLSTGADIKAICTEAGLRALRAHRNKVTLTDFIEAAKMLFKEKEDKCDGMFM